MPNAMLFEHVIEEWLRRDQSNNKASTLYHKVRMVEHDLLPVWRGRSIADITKKDVISLLDAIRDRGVKVKANRVHSALHRFFRWAASREIIMAHPMEGLERSSEQSRERVLTDAELAMVWNGAGKVPVFGDAVKLLALTGARLSEIGKLRWDEIKGDHILLSNGRTKSGVQHVIPLSPPAKALLDAMPHIGEFVFSLGWTEASERLESGEGESGQGVWSDGLATA